MLLTSIIVYFSFISIFISLRQVRSRLQLSCGARNKLQTGYKRYFMLLGNVRCEAGGDCNLFSVVHSDRNGSNN